MSTKRVKRAFFNEDKKITKLNLKKTLKETSLAISKVLLKVLINRKFNNPSY